MSPAIWPRPAGLIRSPLEQLVETQRGARRQDQRGAAPQQTRGDEVAYRPLDGIGVLLLAQLPCQLLERDCRRMQGEDQLQRRRLQCRVFAGGAADVLVLLHCHYIRTPSGKLFPYRPSRPGQSALSSSASSAHPASTVER